MGGSASDNDNSPGRQQAMTGSPVGFSQTTAMGTDLTGMSKAEIDNKISFLKENESIYVPIQAKHRLSNPGNENLIIIEVQNGKYLVEDDIVRFEDIYGRKKDL